MKSEVFKLYEDREDVTLTTYILHNSPEIYPNKKKPAVLVCPGGAYLGCSDREAEPVALAFAAMGYQAFVLRYSVYGFEMFDFMLKGIKDVPLKPERTYPAQMREIGLAMAMIKEHSDEWFVDTDKVAICGFSAGAHNCSMYSVYWDKPIISDFVGKGTEILRPAACILGYPLTDYVYMKENNTDKDFFDAANYGFLGTWEPSDGLLYEVSPALHVDANTPPTYIFSTAADELVPIQHSLRYAHALSDKKIPYELHIFEEGQHGLSVATQASSEAKSQISVDVEKWVPLCDKWLLKRFAYDLPEKTSFELGSK